MPYRKKTTRKKPRYTRRYRKGRRAYRRYRTLGGFPNSKIVKLRYCEELSLTAGLGAFAQHQFRANSVFDPDYTGTGHQPMNFDRWAALYDHYTVIGAKCNIKPIDYNGTAMGPCYAGIFLSTDLAGTSLFTSITDVFENRLTSSKWMMIGPTSSIDAQVRNRGVTSYFSAKKLFGLKNPEDGAAYGALVTGNPSRDAYFNVYVASVKGNNPATARFLVTLDYIVKFAEPVTQSQN